MPTEPLTGARYPASSDAPNVPQDIQNAVRDLSDNTIPRFASTAARDTAYTAWVAAGNTMAAGLTCYVTGLGYQQYQDSVGTWQPLLGVLSYGFASADSASFGADARITGAQNLTTVPLMQGRAYRMKGRGRLLGTNAGAVVTLQVRGKATPTTPVTSDTTIAYARVYLGAAGSAGGVTHSLEGLFTVGATTTYTLSPFLAASAGTAQLVADGRGIADFWVEDAGVAPSGLITL